MSYGNNVNKFRDAISEVVKLDDINKFDEVMFSDEHKDLGHDNREKQAFYYVYERFIYKGQSDILLKHMIFNLKVDEDNALHELLGYMDKKVKKMFVTRDLKEELNKDLSNKDVVKKSIKV